MTSGVTVRDIVHELWRRGDIGMYYILPHQKSLYSLIKSTERDIVVPNISRRFGKSTICVTYSFEECIKRRQDVRYATAFLVDVEEFIKPICDQLLATCPDNVRPEYRESKKTFYFPNGSRFKLVGLDKNPNGIRGNAIDILIIDEAAFVSNLEYLYKSIIVPATADRKFKIIFPSTPPLTPNHFWVQELIPKAKLRGTYLELTLDDNTSLDDQEKQRLIEEVGGRQSTTARREFYCEIIRDPELVIIPEFDPLRVMKPITLPEFYHPLTVIDFGGSMDKHGVIVCFWDFKRAKFCVYREALLNKNTPSSHIRANAARIEKDVRWPNDEVTRIGDAPEQLRIDLLAEDFYCAPPQKEKGSVKANINAVRLAMLKDEIEIDHCCEKLKLTLEYGTWLPTKEDWQRTEDLGHLDLLAALLYAYRHVDRSNPYPSYYGRSVDNAELKLDDDSSDENFLLSGF